MIRSIEKINKEKEAKRKIAQLPNNRKLKYLALFFISIGIVLFIIMLIWYDSLSRESLLVMRGCAGLFAILFVIVISFYLYRINIAYYKQMYRPNKKAGEYGKD